MRRKIIIFCMAAAVSGFLCGSVDHKSKDAINDLKIEYQNNPIGLDEPNPRFSWKLVSDTNGQKQNAYRIKVAASKEELQADILVWDSGKVNSGENRGIAYEGDVLKPAKRYYWKVEIWEVKNRLLVSEEEAFFEMGLLDSGWSDAAFISPPERKAEVKLTDHQYIITYDTVLQDSVSGFVFGAQTNRYGSFYQWEVGNTKDEPGFLQVNRIICNEIEYFQTYSLESIFPDKDDMNGSLIKVRIEVDGDEAVTYVNDILIAEDKIEACPVGRVGYMQWRGSNAAYLDNIQVTGKQGNIILEEDFSGENTIFSPYYHKIENGMLKMRNGTFLSWGEDGAAPMFRREFQIQDKEIERARLYATALGIYEFEINGQQITEDFFNPGKLAYNTRLLYRTHDVTEYLSNGANVIGALLGHGWYDRAVGYPSEWNPWGDRTALLAKLVIDYADGTHQILVTDGDWQVYENGPVRNDDIYQGEFYDANYQQEGWSRPGFTDNEGWEKAAENIVNEEYQSLPREGRADSPVVNYEVLQPAECNRIGDRSYLYDFGKNFSGVCSIQVRGEQGTVIRMRYGEVVNQENMRSRDDEAGTVWTANLLTAEATDYYVLKGGETESFSPTLVYHGFRYLQIDIIGDGAEIEQVEGIALSSPIEQTGSFQCSSPQLNRLYETTIQGMRSNFMDNPTDCPQRDERHGWTGDAQIFAQTASYHGDVYLFYEKFLRDMRDVQNEGGSYPDMAPRNFNTGWDGTQGNASNNCWGDAGVWITWQLYRQYGDKRIIEANYESMCRWVDVLEATSENYIRYWTGYGDHLSLEGTPNDLTDTAWCAFSAGLLERMAAVIGKEEDAKRYGMMAERFGEAWRKQYVTEEGRTIGDSQTSYVVGLDFSLFQDQSEKAAVFLNQNIAARGYHPAVGFVGESRLLSVLSENGYRDTAYALLLQEEYPSWQYAVNKGATTPCEFWNAYEEYEDGTFSWHSSLNHFARGAYASWFYTGILGMQPDESAPGYEKILLKPQIGGGLTYAEGSYESIQGTIQSRWEVTKDGYRYETRIPAGTTAVLYLPDLEKGETRIYELESGYYEYIIKDR